MSDWITDRLPTPEDGFLYEQYVWVWKKGMWSNDIEPRTYVAHYYDVEPGQPWAPIDPPADYVNTEEQP